MTIHIQDDIADQLFRVSQELGKTKNWVINEALREYFERQELRQKIAIGIEQADKGDTIDGETVFAKLREKARKYEETRPE